jgi:hypothetical protein
MRLLTSATEVVFVWQANVSGMWFVPAFADPRCSHRLAREAKHTGLAAIYRMLTIMADDLLRRACEWDLPHFRVLSVSV